MSLLMKRVNLIFLCLIMLASAQIARAQHLSSARGVAVGAFTNFTNDINSIDWNPACLIYIKDWEFNATNFITTSGPAGITLQSIGVGKKFFNNHSAAIRYSPGSVLEFIIPTTLSIIDTNGNSITTKFDKKISFIQSYSLGYGYHLTDKLSLGFSARFIDTKVSDTKYFTESGVIQSQITNYDASLWTMDAGSIYKFNKFFTIGLVFKNLIRIREQDLREEMRDFQLNLVKHVRLGFSYEQNDNFKLGVEIDSKKKIRFGSEWLPVNWIAIRNGYYSSKISDLKLEAVSAGLGFKFKPFEIDLSFLKYIDNTLRSGKIDINTFKTFSLADLEYTPFTPDRVTLSVKINLGRSKEIITRIEYVELFNEVFPSSYQVYAFRPLGKARVRNVSTKPINAKVSFYVDGVMNIPTESKPYTINPNEVLEIPFFAVFNDVINSVKKFSIFDGTVFVHAEPADEYDDRYQTRVFIRGRNDWDGDVMLLRYFNTPSDPEVLRFSRTYLEKYKESVDTVDSALMKFMQAKIIFNELSNYVRYVHDPKLSRDYVQYPAETINLRGGDCDDLTVCYSSLLASVGISTAFIDVVPPNNPASSHIYLIFDTDIEAANTALISDNSKRFIIRKNNNGVETVWIPIETTVISKGFIDAWETGAAEYFQDVTINNGLIKGWVKVVDLPTGF